MEEKKASTFVKCSVYLGIHMMGIFCNVPWVWGNLSVYCSSDFYSQSEGSMGEVAPWLVSLNTIGLTVGVITCDKLRQWLSLRGTLALGITLFNSGVFLSYFSMQHSILLLDFTLRIFPGLGMGIIQACQYTLVVRWTKNYQGLATSSVESTCVLGSVFINQIITFYINPDNVVSDLEIGHTWLFSQPEILAKVPNVFIVYGAVSLCINCTGFFLLMREYPGDDIFLMAVFKRVKSRIGESSTRTLKDNEASLLKHSSSNKGSITYQTSTTGSSSSKEIVQENDINKNVDSDLYRAHEEEDETTKHMVDSIHSVDLSFSQKAAIVESGKWITTTIDENSSEDKGPKDILKTRVFYTLWLTMAVGDFTFIVLTTYYKAFGLVYISDDHFLTYVGISTCIAIAIISYAGGIAVDRIGAKDAIIAFITVMGIISSLFYISPSIDKWIYLIFCILYGAFDFGMMCVLSSCALKLWGQTHLSTNYGLMLSSCVITNIVMPPVIELVILTYGWFTLFTTLAVCIICCLVTCIWQIPRN